LLQFLGRGDDADCRLPRCKGHLSNTRLLREATYQSNGRLNRLARQTVAPALISRAHERQRKFVEAARAVFFDRKKVTDEQAASMVLVDDVHLQSEHVAWLVNQPSVLIEKKAVLGALHPVETDLRLVARIGTKHALEKTAVELVVGIVDKVHGIIKKYVASGQIKKARIDESFKRIMKLKKSIVPPKEQLLRMELDAQKMIRLHQQEMKFAAEERARMEKVLTKKQRKKLK